MSRRPKDAEKAAVGSGDGASCQGVECYIEEKRALVDECLRRYLPPVEGARTRLEEAMRYSVEAGGKRLRPVLCMAAAEAVGGRVEQALPVACALEMIHTYSLIHDDLPAMDDDALRRGVPTNHTVYGEAVAILAGDALLTDAFYVIAHQGPEAGLAAEVVVAVVADIARAAGSAGMVGGQALDLVLSGARVSLDEVERVHLLKTAALMEGAVVAGGRVGGASEGQLGVLRSYGRSLGLAFQIVDDLLDIEGGEQVGKERGVDARRRKATYPAVAGLEEARRRVEVLTEEAAREAGRLGPGGRILVQMATYLGRRTY